MQTRRALAVCCVLPSTAKARTRLSVWWLRADCSFSDDQRVVRTPGTGGADAGRSRARDARRAVRSRSSPPRDDGGLGALRMAAIGSRSESSIPPRAGGADAGSPDHLPNAISLNKIWCRRVGVGPAFAASDARSAWLGYLANAVSFGAYCGAVSDARSPDRASRDDGRWVWRAAAEGRGSARSPIIRSR